MSTSTIDTSHVAVRLPTGLRAELERLAELHERSLSGEVRRALTLHVLAQGLRATAARRDHATQKFPTQ